MSATISQSLASIHHTPPQHLASLRYLIVAQNQTSSKQMFAQITTPSSAPSARSIDPSSRFITFKSSASIRTGRIRRLSFLRHDATAHLHPNSELSSSSLLSADRHHSTRSSGGPDPVERRTRGRRLSSATTTTTFPWWSLSDTKTISEPVVEHRSCEESPTTDSVQSVIVRRGRSRAASGTQLPTIISPPAEPLAGGQTTTAHSYSVTVSPMARARPDDLSAMRTQSDFLNEPGSSQDVGPRAAAVRETTRYLSPRNSATDGRSDPSNSNELPNASLNRHERVTRTLTMPTPETAPHIGQSQMPSIRFLPHHDPRASRPSLNFVALSRVLPSDQAIIKVGRYSEKDTDPNNVPGAPSAAPLGFKSKVVSRRHCELWCQSGQWYIKDVKSSSGTFLNHIRLSQPNLESKPFPLNDGDVVQLGIDFKGGAEMIFRCVKIRVECNRGWQKALNHFK